MKSNKKCFLALSLIVALTIISCASTSLTSVWKDDNYQGNIKNVLIIGISKEVAKKRYFEDEFARQLEAYGVRAVASYKYFPSEEMLPIDAVVSKVGEMNIDAVLITRVVDKKIVETYVGRADYYRPPNYHRGWRNYYTKSYNQGYVVKDEVVVLETNLYDAETEKIIWSAMSETFKNGAEEGLIKEYVGLLIKNMSEKGLLK